MTQRVLTSFSIWARMRFLACSAVSFVPWILTLDLETAFLPRPFSLHSLLSPASSIKSIFTSKSSLSSLMAEPWEPTMRPTYS